MTGIFHRAITAVFITFLFTTVCDGSIAESIDLFILRQIDVGTKLGQCRAVPVNLGEEKGIFIAYCEDAVVDPYVEMFFFPKHTMKLMVFKLDGTPVWKKELGAGVIPGGWFVPFFPFDLDGDGVDEIWFVNNIDDDHPLTHKGRRLECLDAGTGKTIAQYPWPRPAWGQRIGHSFRNFILGGFVKGKPVLVTAQGTYGPMNLQCFNADMSKRWEYKISGGSAGARGSHMCPVVDIDGDGNDEIMWGERCISLDTGKELFCCDHENYRGHSDIIQPILDRKANRWCIYTCRESPGFKGRVVLFDDHGRRLWSDLESGHMDMGWAARIGPNGEHVAMAIRIGAKSAGSKGFFRKSVEEFSYKALTGKKTNPGFSVFCTLPVDLNGDGIHELVRGVAEGNGEVLDRTGRTIGKVGGSVAMASKFMDHPGEQIFCYYPDGTIKIWADKNAKDNKTATWRYNNPFYKANQRLTATGYNIVNLGGL